MQPGRRALTFGETATAIAALTAQLRAAALPVGAPVGLLMERSPEWAVAMLACLAAGHPFVPMPASLPQVGPVLVVF